MGKEVWSCNQSLLLICQLFKLLLHYHPLKIQSGKLLGNWKKIQESFLSLVTLTSIVLIKILSISHGFAFAKVQKVSKKDINSQRGNITWVTLSFRKLHALWQNSKRRRKCSKWYHFVKKSDMKYWSKLISLISLNH